MIHPNFDRIARPYRWLEYAALGPLLDQTRAHHLPALAGRSRAFVVGDGDGRFTASLLAAVPGLRVHAVDCSGAMLKLLRRRAGVAAMRLRLTRADARSTLPSTDTDLVVTHFFLDCLTQPETSAFILDTAKELQPGALWVLSEFRIPAGPMHWPARIYVRSLYLGFRVITGLRVRRLPNYAAPLLHAGFTPVATHHRLFGMLTSELWKKD